VYQLDREADLLMKIRLLREYISRLKHAEEQTGRNGSLNHSFFEHGAFTPHDPNDSTDPSVSQDWIKFDNVYEAHFPTIFLNNDTRNVSDPPFMKMHVSKVELRLCWITTTVRACIVVWNIT
jgi:hypothetical protein